MSKIQSESHSQQESITLRKESWCSQYVKDTIWKPFTTIGNQSCNNSSMFAICQRYNLKAIHNRFFMCIRSGVDVRNMSKIQSESHSQLFVILLAALLWCSQYVKDTIWKPFTTTYTVCYRIMLMFAICQRYNLKAIHNPGEYSGMTAKDVRNMSKIQSESHSQRIVRMNPKSLWCSQYVKDTIWKPFTTNKC